MPTYDYECTACGNTLEAFQSMSAPPLKKCPKCGKNKLQRLIGAGAGFLFKGSGFYITDYRSSDYRAKAKAETDSSSGSGSGAKSEGAAKDKPAKDKPVADKKESSASPPSKKAKD